MSDNDFSFDELLKKVSDEYRNAEERLGQCNVLVIGKTGVGKSTLVNAVFREPLAETGEGRPVTQDIRQYTKKFFPITVYDSPGLELSGEQLGRVTLDVAELIDSKRLEDSREHIHVIWYCINHGANRFEDLERDWLKSIDLKEVPIILVVTQTLTRKRSEFLAWLDAQNLPVRHVIPLLATPKEIDDDYVVKSHGLDRLVEGTFGLLPEVAQNAFVNATKSIDLKAREAFNYVSGYVTGAFAIGAAPIPFADAPILATMQAAMLANITLIFGLPFDRGFMGTVLSSIAGAAGMSAVGRVIVGNLLKMIPGAGTVVGGAISGGTASALTLALGLAYIEALKVYLKAQFKGREIPLSELADIIARQYNYYARSGRQTLKEENEPRTIPISE